MDWPISKRGEKKNKRLLHNVLLTFIIWPVPWAGKMKLSAYNPPCLARKISLKATLVNPLLTKLVWSRWLDEGSTEGVSGTVHKRKK